MEEPVEDFIKSTTMLTDKVASEAKTPTATGQPAGTDLEYLNHERIAKQILTADPELRRILEDGKIDPSNLYSVILREHPPRFANLISSDLDADRIDYLLRTAHQSGLPYGSVDLNYILSQLRLDSKNRICLSRKALRTADHLLLCRYFDYQQVVFHKTVAAFEMVLKKVISHLLRRGLLDCSREQIVKFIENGKWHEFDDSYVLQKVRELRAEPSISPVERIECDSLLTRTAPKLIAEIEKMDKREESVKKTFRHTRQSVREKTDKWASELGLDPQLIYVWAQPVMTLTKIGSHIPVSYEMTTDDSDKSEQIVRILDADGATSSPIFDVGNSLMNILSNYALYSLRVYALLPEADSGTRRAELATCITRDLPDLEWKTLPASPVHKNM